MELDELLQEEALIRREQEQERDAELYNSHYSQYLTPHERQVEEHSRELRLINACANGDVEQAKRYIRHTNLDFLPPYNTYPHWGSTALSAACKDASLPCINLLLRAQADPNAPCDITGLFDTCLVEACAAEKKEAKVVKALLGAGGESLDPRTVAALQFALPRSTRLSLHAALSGPTCESQPERWRWADML